MNTQVHRTFDQHLHFGILVKIALKNPPTIPYTLELRQGDVPKGLPERQRTLPCKLESSRAIGQRNLSQYNIRIGQTVL